MKRTIFLLLIIYTVTTQLQAQQAVVCLTKQYNPHYSNGLGWKGKSAALADNYFLWDNGKILNVKFLSGSKALRQTVQQITKELEQYVNLKFQFVEDLSNIRIDFNNKKIISSALGTMSNMFEQGESTLTIDTSFYKSKAVFRMLVLHTLCHAIGIQDEIIDEAVNWNTNNLKSYFSSIKNEASIGLTMEDFQQKYLLNFTSSMKYDAASLMTAPLPKTFIQSATTVKWNATFSQKDKQHLAALYPKRASAKVDSTIPVINFKNLVIKHSAAKQGVSFYPQFELTTCNKNTVYNLLLFVYDEQGKPLYNDNELYSLDKQLGDVFVLERCTGNEGKTNSPKLDGIQFFLPDYLIKRTATQPKLFVSFKVYYQNYDYEGKWLYESKLFELKY